MSDTVIQARDLKKVYRLYSGAMYRFLDIFGMLRTNNGAYTEHAALAGINLEIHRGEKVAFIGRNGAGKSTLLKLLTGVIEPTSGTLKVTGKAHALLQIGSGFHPDFTGRENVLAYLAQLGVVGANAARLCSGVIEFAELEEYIDQPVKTYSSGMAVRLMFATSTAISPDLLVLDEVLGVGDAYFASKSFERIRELCDGAGTTLLLVTHDIYSAAQLCQRLIWIDSGRIVMDGGPTEVVKAYEDSIRAQEERRLRVRQQTQLQPVARSATEPVLIEVRAKNNRPQPSSVFFSRLAVVASSGTVEIPLDEAPSNEAQGSHLEQGASRWGELQQWNGRRARPMMNYGGPFHKVGAVALLPRTALQLGSEISFELECWSEHACELELVAVVGEVAHTVGAWSTDTGEWSAKQFPWSVSATAGTALQIYPSGDHGAGDITITHIEMIDKNGIATYVFAHGEPATIRFDFSIARPMLLENSKVFIVISRDNTKRICKFMTAELLFDGERCPRGTVTLRIPRMNLSAGTYEVAAEITSEHYSPDKPAQFFSVDPLVYHCLSHAFEFTVSDSGWIGDHTVFEGEGEWAIS